MIEISELLKRSVYAIVFGFMGLIIGILIADTLYSLILKGMDQATTRTVSVIIIVLIAAATLVLGFTKGKSLME